MNPLEVADWHKERAKQLNTEANAKLAEAKLHLDMAQKIEGSYQMPNGETVKNDASISIGGERHVTIEDVRSYLHHNGGRAVHLARHFNVPQDVIQGLVDAEGSGIIVAPRGWLKIKSDELDNY